MVLYYVFSIILKLIDLYSIALVVYALLSWFPGAYSNPFGQFLIKICEPFVNIFRRLNLTFAGLDFSIILAMLALQVLTRILINLFNLIL